MYSGAKDRFTRIINADIQTNKKIYCEPFIGSGAVLFNLNKEFDKYIINDIDRNIIRIYKTFKNISYNTYKTTVDSIFKEFGEFTLLDERTFENKIILREMASPAPSTNKGKNSNIECLFSSYS